MQIFKRFERLGLLAVIMLAGCNSNEIGNSKDVTPETIYFDYHVTGDEELADVTIKAQYRFAGPNGTTLVLGEPSKIELDGKIIPVDSSKFDGAFYETTRPIEQMMEGSHSLVFTDLNKKQFKEEFQFPVFSLISNPPKIISRGDLVFELEGLKNEDYIRILMTDTAFNTRGIDRTDTVKNGRITITKADLENLTNGPIQLEFYKEEEKSLKETTREGGKIYIFYGLKREFELKD